MRKMLGWTHCATASDGDARATWQWTRTMRLPLAILALSNELIKAGNPCPNVRSSIRSRFALQWLVIGSMLEPSRLVGVEQILQPGPLNLRFAPIHNAPYLAFSGVVPFAPLQSARGARWRSLTEILALRVCFFFRPVGIAPTLIDHRFNAFQMFPELSRLARVSAALRLLHEGNAVAFHAIEVVQKFLFRGHWHVDGLSGLAAEQSGAVTKAV
jgi:hypothetical protein